MTGFDKLRFAKAIALLGILFLGIGYLAFLIIFGAGFSLWKFVSDLPASPKKISEISPAGLLALIISGTAIGVYAPMIYWRLGKECWEEWPIQTKIYYSFIGIAFVGVVWGSSIYMIGP